MPNHAKNKKIRSSRHLRWSLLGSLFLVIGVVLATKFLTIHVHEAEAQSPINVAAASQGSTIRYYEWYNPNDPFAPAPCRAQFPTSAIIDGDRKGLNYGNGGVFSTCDEQYYATANPFIFTGPLIIDFNQLRTINHIDLFTAQDNLNNPSDPTANMTFNTEGTKDFIVSYWDPDLLVWINITSLTGTPGRGTDWQNDNHVWKSGSFDNITTNKIRINFYQNRVPASHKIRITEVEAWQANTNHSDFGVTFSMNQALIVGNGQPATASYMFFPSYPNSSGYPGYAPSEGEYYPLIYTFNNIPSGMAFTNPGYTMYSGTDPCLHDDNINSPQCSRSGTGSLVYQPYGFALYGNTSPGTYYFTMTATEQLQPGVTRAPYSHTYTFRLDVLGADIRANAQAPVATVNSGEAASVTWTSFTDPDPSGYTYSGAPSCSTKNSKDSTTWTGLSGSQNSSAITSPITYTVTCSYAGINLSDSVTINIKPPAPVNVRAYNTSTDSSVGCGKIKVTWNQPGSGYTYNIYRNGSLLGSVGSSGPFSYEDTPPVGSTGLSYAAASYDGTTLSDVVTAAPSSISPSPCSSNLSSSDIDLVQLNGSGLSNNLCSGQTDYSTSTIIKEADVVGFKVNLCNTGNQMVSNVSFSLNINNLTNPRNFSYSGCNPTSSVNSNTITFSNIGNINVNGVCAISFDATVQTFGQVQYLNRLDLNGTIYSDSIAYSSIQSTPLPYFNLGPSIQRYESAP